MPTPPHSVERTKSSLPGIDPKAARATWTAALTILLLASIYAIRGTLVVFAIALLLAYLLYPLIDQVSGRFPPKHRGVALAVTYFLVIGLVAAAVIGIGSEVVSEARQLFTHPPDVKGFLQQLQVDHPVLAPVIDAVRSQSGGIVSAAPDLSLHVLSASANLIDFIVIPILSFFMLKDGANIRQAFLSRFPSGEARADMSRGIEAVHTLLLSYMRALLMLCCGVLIIFSVVLSVLGVPYALLLSSIAFFCEFVPLLGPLTAAAVILTVSALSGYPHLWWLFAFLGVFRVVQDYLISPKLMSRGVALHPILVIFGVFAGAEIGGVAGVFLSIPLLALARLALERAGNGH